MLLLLDADRPLTRIAAEARAHPEQHVAARSLPWYRTHPRWPQQLPGTGTDFGDVAVADAGLRIEQAQMIRTALLGGPSELRDVLAEDAEIWFPTACFCSRAEAETALADQTPTLAVVGFRVDHLFQSGSSVAAQWQLELTQTDVVLVDDDLLVERCEGTVSLVGATTAELSDGRITRMSTFFDGASLIEQIILGDRRS